MATANEKVTQLRNEFLTKFEMESNKGLFKFNVIVCIKTSTMLILINNGKQFNCFNLK